MLKFKYIIILFIFLTINNIIYSQDYKISSYNNSKVNTCSGKFLDSQGEGSNYLQNEDYNITICSNNSGIDTQVGLTFSIDSKISSTDTIYIYDGEDSLSNLINKYTNDELSNLLIKASKNNTSGCLHLKFKSTSNSTTHIGWSADINCFPKCQEIIATYIIDSISPPLVNNSIQLCPNESVFLVADASFPENNNSYFQSIDSCSFVWYFGDGNTDTSKNTIHSYNTFGGYKVSLKVTDQYECESSNNIILGVKTSDNPIENILSNYKICQSTDYEFTFKDNDNEIITISEKNTNKLSSLSVNDTTFIPDGGVQGGECYSTSVRFTVFNEGQKINNSDDIISICANIEHSWIGDIGIKLYCPNGNFVNLKEFNQIGDGNLGIPNLNDSTPYNNPLVNPPGIGFDYCWTVNADSTMNSMAYNDIPEGDYLSDDSFSALIGCPMNGLWSIEICDNWEQDNGYIFSWQINLDPKLIPSEWTYEIPIDSTYLYGAFTSKINDSSYIINSNQAGIYNYNIKIVDAFNCIYDTNFDIEFVEQPSLDLGQDVMICGNDKVLLSPIIPNGYNIEWSDESSNYFYELENNSNIIWAKIYNDYCIEYDTINVIECNKNSVLIPDAFSPNNDNINDVLFVYGQNIESVNFSVFNIEGMILFNSTSKDIGWDGTYKNKECKVGSYLYYVEAVLFNGQKFKLKGEVLLIR